MDKPEPGDIAARLRQAQAALQKGDRADARRLANEAFALASSHGPVEALPDAAFLIAMATEEPEERITALDTALNLFESQGRADEAAAIRQRLGLAQTQPGWASQVQTAVAAGDLEVALQIVADARRTAQDNAHELAALDGVEQQLKGMQASRGGREQREGESVDAHLERLIARAYFELSTGDAAAVRKTCEALVEAGDAAGPAYAIQGGLVAVQAFAALGDIASATTQLEACRALLEEVPEAKAPFAQVEAILRGAKKA